MRAWYVFGTTNKVSRKVASFPQHCGRHMKKPKRLTGPNMSWVLRFEAGEGEFFFLFSTPPWCSLFPLYWDERIPEIDWQPTRLSYYADPCTSWVLTTVVSTSTKYKFCFSSSVPVNFIIPAPKLYCIRSITAFGAIGILCSGKSIPSRFRRQTRHFLFTFDVQSCLEI